MAVTFPSPTYTDGQLMAAADLNIIRDNLDYVKGYGARVYNSADITLTTSVAAALTFDTERYDDNSFHSTSVNTSRFTIPVTRRYRVGGSVRFASNATGLRQVYARVNGSTIIALMTLNANATSVTDIVLGDVEWSFTAGDYVELVCAQTSGGNLNVSFIASSSPEFWISSI